jgi:predicted amidohydrolase YtcJ
MAKTASVRGNHFQRHRCTCGTFGPYPLFHASVTRKTLKMLPEGGYEPDQKMTREQALKSYTLDGAFAEFEENFKGSIEVGKAADFTVFDKNIMEVPENEILATKVAMTVVGGKIVHEINQLPNDNNDNK